MRMAGVGEFLMLGAILLCGLLAALIGDDDVSTGEDDVLMDGDDKE